VIVLVTCTAHRRTSKVIKAILVIIPVVTSVIRIHAKVLQFPIKAKIVAAFVLNGEAIKCSLLTKNN
jgi:hypothetical protein